MKHFSFLFLICFTLKIVGVSYQDSGVSIDTGDALVQEIKPWAKSTARPGTQSELGGFSGFFDLAKLAYKDPILLSTTDGVGSKIKIAQKLNKNDTIGTDLVAMNVNDLIVHGAEPLFFLDYFATSRLQLDQAKEVIVGIAKACKESGCALVGGETSEMPGMYQPNEYDIAGFAVGIVEREHLLPKLEQMKVGDVVIGLASSGIHSNGYSLVRHIVEKKDISLHDKPPFSSLHATLGHALLEPTLIYVSCLLPLIRQQKLIALAHITGGGLWENIPRVLPDHLAVTLDVSCWNIPPIFHWIAALGSVEPRELSRTYNCGIGMVAIVNRENAKDILAHLNAAHFKATIIGSVTERAGDAPVIINNLELLKPENKELSPRYTAQKAALGPNGINFPFVVSDSEQSEELYRTMPKKLKMLIVGSGGREHALAWKAAQSEQIEKVFVAPGNAGTCREKNVENVPLAATDIPALVDFAKKNQIDITLIGPEAALQEGIADALHEANLACVGPCKMAARLETSKIWAKDFMMRNHIPTAAYATFADPALAKKYCQTQTYPLVIKADGLAAGKGVIIASNVQQAHEAIESLMITKEFAHAGSAIVIEEYLAGQELSFIVLTDGKHTISLLPSHDHKKLYDGERGPNTGGMGAYCAVPWCTADLQERIMHEIIEPTLRGLQQEGIEYQGFLYAGLMITPLGDPKVLEFNCRLGDPETQSLMMNLKTDLVYLCNACTHQQLDCVTMQWDDQCALNVILAAPGYPNFAAKGQTVYEPEIQEGNQWKLFHGGTKKQNNKTIITGGRVFCLAAQADSLEYASQKAYMKIQELFSDSALYYRRDIGVN